MTADSATPNDAPPPADTTQEPAPTTTLVTPAPADDATGAKPAGDGDQPAGDDSGDQGGAQGDTDGGSGDEPPAFEPLTAEALEVPEGFNLEGEASDKFLDIINRSGQGDLSPAETANEFLALHAAALQESAEAANTAWQEQQDTWVAEVQKEFGSDLAPKQAQIEKVVSQFGDDELRTALALTGAGNHPAFFRFFAKLADQFTEAAPVQSTPGSERPDVASRLYPSMKG